jgi:hypothetical protein
MNDRKLTLLLYPSGDRAMTTADDFRPDDQEQSEEDKIEQGFSQMEMLYRSRCIQPPQGSNVTVREIEKEE